MNLFKNWQSTRCAASVFLLAFSCQPEAHAQTVSTHPVVDTWSWSLFNNKCTETLQYRMDGVLLSTSGEALTEWRYIVSNSPDAQGFYKLDQISTRHNAKKDCSEDVVDEAGLEVTRFIQLNPAKDQMIICRTASLQACFGPLQRRPSM